MTHRHPRPVRKQTGLPRYPRLSDRRRYLPLLVPLIVLTNMLGASTEAKEPPPPPDFPRLGGIVAPTPMISEQIPAAGEMTVRLDDGSEVVFTLTLTLRMDATLEGLGDEEALEEVVTDILRSESCETVRGHPVQRRLFVALSQRLDDPGELQDVRVLLRSCGVVD